MRDSMLHRGPDSGGHFLSSEDGLAMGFRRLAIIDLSENGNQPMTSSCERYTTTYNGEIYNYKALRQVLEAEGRRFRSTSDTEVMLEGFSAWGIDKTLERMIGMFAIAVWDREKQQMTLIRDRLGIKPLYWGIINGSFFYGSELKTLRAKPGWDPTLDRNALTQYLRFNYVPDPLTIYEDVSKLPPGHKLEFRPRHEGSPRVTPYWSVNDAVDGPRQSYQDDAAIQKLDELLGDAVERRMVADVPLGVLLSGGIDSSVVAAMMQARSDRPIQSFTIGFDDAGYNEADQAAAVATHIGTDHTSLTLTGADARTLITNLADWYDEPFADSSSLPTYLVSKLAKDAVTVALSGDGGDEVFFGYNRYQAASAAWDRAENLPDPLRSALGHGLKSVSARQWDSLSNFIPKGSRPRMMGDKMHKIARILNSDDQISAYLSLVSHWQDPGKLTGGGTTLDPVFEASDRITDFTERMAYLDTLTYLPGDILTKVDRASMAVSLEARVPLLDHRVVEFAWTLPKNMKIRDGKSKWALRQVLYNYVPQELMERPKAGFAIPLAAWLRGPLRDWAEELLNQKRLKGQGLLAPGPIRAAWDDHQAGRGNHAEPLWNILMFQAWYDRWILNTP